MRRALLIVVALLAASPAAAQEDDPRALFDQGVTALDEGRFADAADLLARSLAIRDSLSARYNRAVALRGAGRYLEAITDTERYLELATERRHARTRARAETMLEELRASVATLEIDIVGDPDEVRIDDERVAGDNAHLELRRDPGEVHVRVTREGYEAVDRTITLGAGARETLSLDAAEAPLPATLTVEALPPLVSIEVDGETLGAGHVELTRPAGTYRLAFGAEGYLPQAREVSLMPGESASLSISLMEIPPTPLVEEWWFWTLIGAGVAALGAAIAIAVVVSTDTPQTELGSLGFSQEVLRWSM